jgi:glycosyltransferase involved in cell wall biosynthesis
MSVSCPLVSVIMPSFNHEAYIGSAIASVLCQTMDDLELLIVDDGSCDRSPTVIANINDKRINFENLEQNRGACEAMNIALRKARGRFIAVCNSDDEWHPDKLERQLKIIEGQERIKAVFSDVVWIDEVGAPLDGLRAPPFESVFRQANRSRWTWMRYLLEQGNGLCHPSVLIRREIFGAVGEYDNRLRQLPDLDMWLRVLAQGDIFVSAAKLLRFRLHQSNTSAASPEVSRRSINEHRLIVRKALAGISVNDFIRAFGSKAVCLDGVADFQTEKAVYLLGYSGKYAAIFREYGLDLLYEVMGDRSTAERLRAKYGINSFIFQREMSVHSPWIGQALPAQAPTDETIAEKLERFRSKDMAKSIITRYKKKIWRRMRRAFSVEK